jgi:hypothetical protein
VDVAAGAGNEGVDERRETRGPDPPGTGQQHDGPRRRPISRGGILWSRGFNLAGCGGGADLGRGRAAGSKHGLEVGDEGGRERVALGSVFAGGRLHRPRPRRGYLPPRVVRDGWAEEAKRAGERERGVYGGRKEGSAGVDGDDWTKVGMD